MIAHKEKMPTQNKKLFELIEKETNGKIKPFAEMIGMSPQRITRLFQVDIRTKNGSFPRITEDVKDAICLKFGISYDYFDKADDTETHYDFDHIQHKDIILCGKKTGKPYYNVDFEMGYDTIVNDQTTNPEYLIDFEPYNKCDCWCNARGNSMFPTISSGDVIAIKEIKDPSCLISGEIYAIVTTNDLRTIKRINDNGDSITLIPDNKDYPEQTIGKDLVLRVYRVLGCMKLF